MHYLQELQDFTTILLCNYIGHLKTMRHLPKVYQCHLKEIMRIKMT